MALLNPYFQIQHCMHAPLPMYKRGPFSFSINTQTPQNKIYKSTHRGYDALNHQQRRTVC